MDLDVLSIDADGPALLEKQRADAAAVNRVLALIATGTVTYFALAIPYYLPLPLAIQYALFAIPMIGLLLAYASYTLKPGFTRAKHLEVWGIGIIAALNFGSIKNLSIAAGYLGWQPHGVLFVNVATFYPFAVIAFVANFRGFAIFTLLFFGAYVATLINLHLSVQAATFHLASVMTVIALGLYVNWALNYRATRVLQLDAALRREKARSEELLYSILPKDVALRLHAGQSVADSFSDATVVFVDLVGSSELARTLSAGHFIQALDRFFAFADEAVEKHGIEKVKTIGDAYLAIAGGRQGGDQLAAVRFAIEVVTGIQSLAKDMQIELNVRAGIHTGPVIGGVIGKTKAAYDYWGNTMNVAARVESAAPTGGISVTKQVYYGTRDQIVYGPPRNAELKGIGELKLFDVAESNEAKDV